MMQARLDAIVRQESVLSRSCEQPRPEPPTPGPGDPLPPEPEPPETLPPDIVRGRYTLEVGLFDPASGTRLPVGPAGSTTNSAHLGVIIVVQ